MAFDARSIDSSGVLLFLSHRRGVKRYTSSVRSWSLYLRESFDSSPFGTSNHKHDEIRGAFPSDYMLTKLLLFVGFKVDDVESRVNDQMLCEVVKVNNRPRQ